MLACTHRLEVGDQGVEISGVEIGMGRHARIAEALGILDVGLDLLDRTIVDDAARDVQVGSDPPPPDWTEKRKKQMLVSFADNEAEFARTIADFDSGLCDAIIAVGGTAATLTNNVDNIITIDGGVDGKNRSISYDYRFACESACRYLSSKGHSPGK